MKTIRNIGIRLGKAAFSAACITLLAVNAQAQDVSTANRQLMQIAEETSKTGWINFRPTAELNPLTMFVDHRTAFGLTAADEMRFIKSTIDQYGNTHYRYQQYYNGYKIQGAEYIVHQDAKGHVYCANGKMVNGLQTATAPVLSEQDALNKAMVATGAKGFLWQNANAEARLKARKKDTRASFFPKGELVYSMPGGSETIEALDLSLCWKFDVNTDSTARSKRMFVDAETGKIIKQLPLELTCDAATAATSFNGNRTIYTSPDGSDYILDNDCSGNANIHLYNANVSQTLNYATEYTGYSGNTWNYRYSQVQSFWGLREAYGYFKGWHNRSGYDDDDADMEGYNNAIFPGSGGTLTGNNASWSSTEEVWRFGTGMSNQTEQDDVNTLDIVGHEFTHAVTQYSAGLDYEKESGALNESFSDIFGECVEYRTLGSCDYLMGADRGAIRSFANPDSFNHPDTYFGANWQPTNCGTPAVDNDYCGVHTNSGVQNYVFYLIAHGDTGTNDNGVRFSVTGIGMNSTALIAYHALTAYLTSASNFYDAREAWIHAAIDIFGNCSNESIQVGNAWYAAGVGIGLAVYNNNVCGNYPPGSANYEIQGVNSVVGSGTGCSNTILASAYTVTYSGGFAVDLMPGFVAESGCSFIARTYACAVTNYRVASMDEINETTETESRVQAASSGNDGISVFPNPFKNRFTITFNARKDENAAVKLYDILGKEIKSFGSKFLANDGNNSLEYQTENLPSGIYILKLEINSDVKTYKISKN